MERIKNIIKKLSRQTEYIGLFAVSQAYTFLNKHEKSTPFTDNDLIEFSKSCHLLPWLVKNHVSQFNPSSCSVASAAVTLNAVFDLLGMTGPKVDQQEILEKIRIIHWKERVSPSGHNGKRGLPIQKLGKAIVNSLEKYQIPFKEVKTICFEEHTNRLTSLKTQLRHHLTSLCRDSHRAMIAHFNQGLFTKDLHIPHISPVGAYDPHQDRVLIIDVDPEQTTPYWVSFDLFFKSLNWNYNGLLKRYGYSGGGYVYIQYADSNKKYDR